jgi:hypothetical protein
MINKASGVDKVNCVVEKKPNHTEKAIAQGVFTVICYDKDGNLKWEEKTPNLVVDVGLEAMTEATLGAGTQITTWYLGLYGAAVSNDPAAGDTMASHAGWTEIEDYTESTRPTCSFGASSIASTGTSVISNTGTPAAFTMDDTVTVGGAFLTSDDTKGGSTGVLFSAADFQAPGDRSVVSGDTINVTYTFTLSAT